MWLTGLGTIPISSRLALVLDTPSFQLCLSTGFYSYVVELHTDRERADCSSLGDMKINGPYYSDVLLNAILSHSLRWCRSEPKIGHLLEAYDGGAQFRNSALTGLFDSLKAGDGQIPTIQALLLLSAQESGRGNRTQAWLYSGMAFRLVEDLGITIDSRKYSSVQFSDEDIEIRNRLFWSCYFWDKLVSLYFGRSPIIQDSPVSPPRTICKSSYCPYCRCVMSLT